MRFMDIRKRINPFPKMGIKANFIAIPTTAGTGSEVTPFTVITDERTGIKYPLADYELLPNIAIVDIDYMMDMPPGLTAASGIDALTHSLEAYVSMLASDYTDGLALTAIKNVLKYLPIAYTDGKNEEAREKMANASTIAGMAFANAFLGICHSMAHKLGAAFHLPHGVANALLINEVIKFNATENPRKMGTFSQYKYPMAIERYAEIASFIGLGGNNDDEKTENLIKKIDELKVSIGIKKAIKDYDISEEDFMAQLDNIVEQAFDDQCTGANPRYPLMEEMKEMYLNVYHGR
jgi:acetaldehyde dehydrogenase/alcohol dehydrogenase